MLASLLEESHLSISEALLNTLMLDRNEIKEIQFFSLVGSDEYKRFVQN